MATFLKIPIEAVVGVCSREASEGSHPPAGDGDKEPVKYRFNKLNRVQIVTI